MSEAASRRSSIRSSWSGLLRDEARTRLWPLPVVAVVGAIALGVALPRLDAAVDQQVPSWLDAYLFSGGADAARTVLSAIATSLISVTSLTFSLTVVTLQLASSQYSPRLLRTFTRDRFVHRTLAVFLGSFVYALSVLRTVRTADAEADGFVPQISVTVAYCLCLASVLSLVLFLAHLAQEIRVETILRNVHQGAQDTLRRVLRSPADAGSWSARDPATLPTPPPTTAVLTLVAPSSGFIVDADTQGLRDAAIAAGAVLVVDKCVGAAIVEGVPVGRAWASEGGMLTADDRDRLQDRLGECLTVRFERSGLRDLSFGLRQVTDVAVKALSPSINDPTTAVHALNHSSALLGELMRTRLEPLVVRDDDDRIRVGAQRPTFAELLDLALSQPRLYGADDPFVMTAIVQLLSATAGTATAPEERNAVRDQLRRTSRAVAGSTMDTADRAQLLELVDRLTADLERFSEG